MDQIGLNLIKVRAFLAVARAKRVLPIIGAKVIMATIEPKVIMTTIGPKIIMATIGPINWFKLDQSDQTCSNWIKLVQIGSN